MSEPTLITQGSNNVFEDLGFKAEEAMSLKARADLMLVIRERGWTEEQAAEHFEVSRPRIRDLMSGEIDRFGVDEMVRLQARR